MPRSASTGHGESDFGCLQEPDRTGATCGGMTDARIVSTACAALSLLVACQPGGADQGAARGQASEVAIPDPASSEPYAGIGGGEAVRLVGTEPFWGGLVAGTSLTYTTPDNPDGTTIAVERFAGRGGLSFSGSLAGAALEMAVTSLECSDGMSDRTYPFTVTLEIGDDSRHGCGWTERQPFKGPEQP
jgi:uncharacterized membrane protein